MKLASYVAVVLVLILFVGFTIVLVHNSSHPSAKPYSCVAGPDEQCASDQFYADFKHWQELRDDLKNSQQVPQVRELQDKTDLFNGITTRLNSQVPKDYQWNEQKMRFVKAQAPNSVTMQAPAPNAPQNIVVPQKAKK